MDDQEDPAEVPSWIRVVRLPVEVDYGIAERVNRLFVAAFAPGIKTVIADFSHCIFFDSSGIREMVLAQRQAVAHGAGFRLVVPSDRLMRIFRFAGLASVFEFYPTLTAALAGDLAVG